jgi:hypothetical protein
MPEKKPRRGQPPNAFREYPLLNEAYIGARDNILSSLEIWNRQNPDRAVSQVDLPLMHFIHSCIPSELKPEPFGNNAREMRPRMRGILYPLIQSGAIDPDVFAERMVEKDLAKKFLSSWLAERGERRATPQSQPRPKLIDYIKAGFVTPLTTLILRYRGKTYYGHITTSGRVEIDIGNGPQLFQSPNAVLSKGFDSVGETASPIMFVVDENGVETCLQDIKENYIQWKGL